ncbi:hypothetical protein ACHAWF_013079 [Thalassiosira exigua]
MRLRNEDETPAKDYINGRVANFDRTPTPGFTRDYLNATDLVIEKNCNSQPPSKQPSSRPSRHPSDNMSRKSSKGSKSSKSSKGSKTSKKNSKGAKQGKSSETEEGIFD